jgi:hypothetical protein
VLSEIAKLFTGKSGDRRAHPRKVVKYAVWWPKPDAQPVQGVGLEVSPTGALFVLREKPPDGDFNIIMQLGERRLGVRVSPLRHDDVPQGATTWYRFATKYSGISADDWDFIVRFVHDQPEPDTKGSAEIKAAMAQTDDSFRLLPLAIQQRIVEILVTTNKLTPPPEGAAPLLKMDYAGVIRKGEKQVHRFHVHSRVNTSDEVQAFDTTFLIDQDGHVSIQSSRASAP